MKLTIISLFLPIWDLLYLTTFLCNLDSQKFKLYHENIYELGYPFLLITAWEI